jgi:hypothetical protein
MSRNRAFGESVYALEEVACRPPAIGEGNVQLEVRLGTPYRKSLHCEAEALGEREQRVGVREGCGVFVMNNGAVFAYRPIARDPHERVATGPASGIKHFKFHRGSTAQAAAHDQCVSPAPAATECPHPWQIARFQKDDERQAGKGRLGLADHHLHCGGSEPTHRGAATEDWQAVLHPAHERAPEPHVPNRAGSKPSNHRDCYDADKLCHGGSNDNTAGVKRWKRSLREFFYGVAGYEIAHEALEIRAKVETIFMLGVFGDMLGMPILPPYYGLRLLPYVVPQIETWKRRCLRERELGSDHEHHLHGV